MFAILQMHEDGWRQPLRLESLVVSRRSDGQPEDTPGGSTTHYNARGGSQTAQPDQNIGNESDLVASVKEHRRILGWEFFSFATSIVVRS